MPKIGHRNKALIAKLRNEASHPLVNRNGALRYRNDLMRLTMNSKQPRNAADIAEISAATDVLMQQYEMMDPMEVPSIVGRGLNGRTLDDSDYDLVVKPTVIETAVNAQWTGNQAKVYGHNASAWFDILQNKDTGKKFISLDYGKQQLTNLGLQADQQSLYNDNLPILREDTKLESWRERNMDDEDEVVLDMRTVPTGFDATSQTVGHMDPNLVASYIRNAGALI